MLFFPKRGHTRFCSIKTSQNGNNLHVYLISNSNTDNSIQLCNVLKWLLNYLVFHSVNTGLTVVICSHATSSASVGPIQYCEAQKSDFKKPERRLYDRGYTVTSLHCILPCQLRFNLFRVNHWHFWSWPIWRKYLSHVWPVKAQASLRIRRVLPEPSLFAHIK